MNVEMARLLISKGAKLLRDKVLLIDCAINRLLISKGAKLLRDKVGYSREVAAR
jgi:hypothetical protein